MSSIFENHLDLSNIGLIGHSTGGGASVKTGIVDDRVKVKAIFGLDAWVEPIKTQYIEEGLNIPSLFIRSEEWEEGFNNENLNRLLNNNQSDCKLIQIDGSNHIDFSMAYMYSPLSSFLNMTGILDGKYSTKIQHDFILDFFNENLKGMPTNYELLLNQYKEVNEIIKK